MIGFKTDLITKRIMGQDYIWILECPLIYENEKYRITVFDGFDFDFASIPTLLRGIIPKNGAKYDRASCLHDAMYASQIFRKEECDLIFLEAMLSDGTNSFLAKLMYEAVTIGGEKAYNDCYDIAKYRDLIKVEVLNGNS